MFKHCSRSNNRAVGVYVRAGIARIGRGALVLSISALLHGCGVVRPGLADGVERTIRQKHLEEEGFAIVEAGTNSFKITYHGRDLGSEPTRPKLKPEVASGTSEDQRKAAAAEFEKELAEFEATRAKYERAMEAARAEEEAARSFQGVNLGVGFGVVMDVGGRDRVESATAVNGVVRVDRKRNIEPRLVSEIHYLLLPPLTFLGISQPGDWGIGPFAAIQSSSTDLLDSFGLGLMLGFRATENHSQAFTIGVGVIYDRGAKVLGGGLRDGAPLPAGEESVRLREEGRPGLLLMASFAF